MTPDMEELLKWVNTTGSWLICPDDLVAASKLVEAGLVTAEQDYEGIVLKPRRK